MSIPASPLSPQNRSDVVRIVVDHFTSVLDALATELRNRGFAVGGQSTSGDDTAGDEDDVTKLVSADRLLEVARTLEIRADRDSRAFRTARLGAWKAANSEAFRRAVAAREAEKVFGVAPPEGLKNRLAAVAREQGVHVGVLAITILAESTAGGGKAETVETGSGGPA